MSDFDLMTGDWDDVEPSYGFAGEPLPSGWYPVKVESILDKSKSRNGAPTVRMQLLVLEGKEKDQRAFVNMTLGPAELDRNGAQRSAQEKADVAVNLKRQMRGFLSALGVTTGQPVGDGDEKLYSFFSVDSWAGREFMAFIKHQAARGEFAANNRLNGYRAMDDEKKGLSAWRAAQANGAETTTSPQTI